MPNELKLDAMMAKIDVPADLQVELRGAKIRLHSNGYVVEMGVPFEPMAWNDFVYRYAGPAMLALTRHQR
jgi:hypothetical protein